MAFGVNVIFDFFTIQQILIFHRMSFDLTDASQRKNESSCPLEQVVIHTYSCKPNSPVLHNLLLFGQYLIQIP